MSMTTNHLQMKKVSIAKNIYDKLNYTEFDESTQRGKQQHIIPYFLNNFNNVDSLMSLSFEITKT